MQSELRDIKPLLEIPDSSYYLFLGMVGLLALLVLLLLFFLFKKFWRAKRESLEQRYFEEFKNLDWHEVKSSAYRATYLGRKLTQNHERTQEIYEQFLVMLEPYKYRKEVAPIDEKTLQHYNLLVHIIDESL